MSGKKTTFFEYVNGDDRRKVVFDDTSVAIWENDDICRIVTGTGIETLARALRVSLAITERQDPVVWDGEPEVWKVDPEAGEVM